MVWFLGVALMVWFLGVALTPPAPNPNVGLAGRKVDSWANYACAGRHEGFISAGLLWRPLNRFPL